MINCNARMLIVHAKRLPDTLYPFRTALNDVNGRRRQSFESSAELTSTESIHVYNVVITADLFHE